MSTILIVDDEQDIVDLLTYNLKKEGYEIWSARNGIEALELAARNPDLCILDVMMPAMNGWEVCKALRKDPATASLPVIFLTARDGEIDEVLGLELGADDYITKPVRMRTLLARVQKTLSQRALSQPTPESAENISISDIVIYPGNYVVEIAGTELQFPKKEFEVLMFLARHPDRVISRQVLLNEIWGHDVYVVDRTIDVHIRKIRKKLGAHATHLETVKGVGYRFRKEV